MSYPDYDPDIDAIKPATHGKGFIEVFSIIPDERKREYGFSTAEKREEEIEEQDDDMTLRQGGTEVSSSTHYPVSGKTITKGKGYSF